MLVHKRKRTCPEAVLYDGLYLYCLGLSLRHVANAFERPVCEKKSCIRMEVDTAVR